MRKPARPPRWLIALAVVTWSVALACTLTREFVIPDPDSPLGLALLGMRVATTTVGIVATVRYVSVRSRYPVDLAYEMGWRHRGQQQ